MKAIGDGRYPATQKVDVKKRRVGPVSIKEVVGTLDRACRADDPTAERRHPCVHLHRQ